MSNDWFNRAFMELNTKTDQVISMCYAGEYNGADFAKAIGQLVKLRHQVFDSINGQTMYWASDDDFPVDLLKDKKDV